MVYHINDDIWVIEYVPPGDKRLRRSNGTYTIGMTDGSTHTVYVCNTLRGALHEKVIAHELVHCFMFSYGINIDIETEEFIADWVATYGKELIYLLDEIMYKIKIS